MISPSAVKRVKYEQEQSNEFVRLQEYIIFEDDRDNEKYIVFKFRNCVTQWLHELRFTVSEFDSENQLIQKSTVSYKNTKVKESSSFVPSAKYKANGNTDHISVEVEAAVFERMEFSKGEVKELKFDYTDYKKDVKDETVEASKTGNRKDGYVKPTFFSDDDKKKKNKKVTIKNITNSNRSFAMPIFSIIMSVVVIAICAFTAVYSKDYSYRFKDVNTGLVYTVQTKNNKETSYVSITGYEGQKSTTVTIKEKVKNTATGKEYTVSTISQNAFMGNAVIRTVNFTGNLSITIEQNAFKDCTSLNKVTAQNSVKMTVKAYAFTDCTSLTSFSVSNATLQQNCFAGCVSLQSITAYTSTSSIPAGLFGKTGYTDLPNLKTVVYTKEGTSPIYSK